MWQLVFALAISSAFAGDINPDACTSGGGSASNIQVSVSGISGRPPYTMQAGIEYTVTFTFTPTADSGDGATFTVSASPDLLGLPGIPQIAIQTAAAGPFFQDVATNATQTFQIPLAFGLLGLDATFEGVVNDSSNNVIACMQGAVSVTL